MLRPCLVLALVSVTVLSSSGGHAATLGDYVTSDADVMAKIEEQIERAGQRMKREVIQELQHTHQKKPLSRKRRQTDDMQSVLNVLQNINNVANTINNNFLTFQKDVSANLTILEAHMKVIENNVASMSSNISKILQTVSQQPPVTTPGTVTTTTAPVTGLTANCNFDMHTTCNWASVHGNFQWTLGSGSTFSANTGPSNDVSGNGRYVYIETSSPRKQGERAVLEGPLFDSNKNSCLCFDYHMYGDSIGTLNVKLLTTSSNMYTPNTSTIWSLSGDQGNQWRKKCLNIPRLTSGAMYKIQFEGVVGRSWSGDIAIDEITLGNGVCNTAPAVGTSDCDFDKDMCHWSHDQATFNWTLRSGGTTSSFTGPSGDTTGLGFYVYIESSLPRKKGDVARIIGPLENSTQPKCLAFGYHMYGNNINTLNVYRRANTTNGTHAVRVWSKTGDQGNSWKWAFVNFTPGSYQIQFEGICGSSYNGDIAIDNITLTNGTCNGTVPTTTTSPPTTPTPTPMPSYYVRLVNGNNANEGMVELVYKDNNGIEQKGTICGDHFGDREANVTCHELGYSHGDYTGTWYSSHNPGIVLDDVNCTGHEQFLSNCTHNKWKQHNCNDSQLVTVKCRNGPITPTMPNYYVRLVNGSTAGEGIVNIVYKDNNGNETAGTICGDHFSDREANVTCHELGYRYGVSNGSWDWPKNDSNVLVDVHCIGIEQSLFNCVHTGWNNMYNCSNDDVASVRCSNDSSTLYPSTTTTIYPSTPSSNPNHGASSSASSRSSSPWTTHSATSTRTASMASPSSNPNHGASSSAPSPSSTPSSSSSHGASASASSPSSASSSSSHTSTISPTTPSSSSSHGASASASSQSSASSSSSHTSTISPTPAGTTMQSTNQANNSTSG